MNKTFLIYIFGLITTNVFSQQFTSTTDNKINILRGEEVANNKSLVNPVFLSDTVKLNVDFQAYEEFLGITGASNEYSLQIASSFPKNRLSIGLNSSYTEEGLMKHRTIIFQGKRKLNINNTSNIGIGLNIGLWQYNLDLSSLSFQYPDPVLTDNSDWKNLPMLDVGISYNYLIHNFGISYKNITNSNISFNITNGDSDFDILESGLIGSYHSDFKILKSFSFSPSLFGSFTKSNTYGILLGTIDYKKKVSLGFQYNTLKIIGFQLQSILFKKIKLGYWINQEIDSKYNNNRHGLNIGFLIN